MWTWFEQLSQWHWFIFGLFLLMGEALGASGFLLGTAIASLLMGVLFLSCIGVFFAPNSRPLIDPILITEVHNWSVVN